MNNRGAFTFRVDGGVEASGAQAKKHRVRVVAARIERERERERRRNATAEPEDGGNGWETERANSAREIRAGFKGSYYNKFVGGLRSGNNSETASDSKDVLIVAFIQMEVEGDELQRMRPVSMRPSRLSPSSLLYLYVVPFSFEFSVGVVLACCSFRSG
ncbi:unnamed protein product [Lasius platythorax]|uniref:Uncharacterized protein n=1 Tax=Lasius platythorax TaxID=488582 RepID=A0AAV2NZ07_9HYME